MRLFIKYQFIIIKIGSRRALAPAPNGPVWFAYLIEITLKFSLNTTLNHETNNQSFYQRFRQINTIDAGEPTSKSGETVIPDKTQPKSTFHMLK